MITKYKACSVPKPEEGNTFCEDASMASECIIAVSDGAGGGGVFADRWAQYLVNNTPNNPITTAEDFQGWIDAIWEPFYNDMEALAKEQGGMLLNKFYDEGSFATYVAAWRVDNKVKWVAYGDSVVFCYERASKCLSHSFTELAGFASAPALINCKEEVDLNHVRLGEFDLSANSYVFACSDALAHYVLMMYQTWKGEQIPQNEVNKNTNYIALAQTKTVDFEEKVLKPLFNSLRDNKLAEHCKKLYVKSRLLTLDDYSLARLQ